MIGSDSPEGALDLLKQLKLRNDNVALLLADQRMPRMSGIEFLQEGMQIFPDAKRALLTAYADTNAAISAINDANVNYFFLKPWDPLRPIISTRNWMICSMIGGLPMASLWGNEFWARAGRLEVMSCAISWHGTTSLINGSTLSFSASDPETKRLLDVLGPEAANLPIVLFPDGTKLLESMPSQVAQKVGLRTRAQTSFYDLAIIGGGPAGLAAAVYGASEGLHTVMVRVGHCSRTGGSSWGFEGGARGCRLSLSVCYRSPNMSLSEEVLVDARRKRRIPFLKTELLTLRAPRPEDVTAIALLANDRRIAENTARLSASLWG